MTPHQTLAQSLCDKFKLTDGPIQTDLTGVQLFRSEHHQMMTPHLYSKGIVVLFSGSKLARLNDYEFRYGPSSCLIMAASYPISCETFASPEVPLIGLYIELDLNIIQQLSTHMTAAAEESIQANSSSLGLELIERSEAMNQCLTRLLAALHNPMDAQVLGPGILKEFFYRLMQTELCGLLTECCQVDSHVARLNVVIDYVQQHYNEKLDIGSLASMASMSVSTFHRVFKQTVTEAPLQYIKKVRLNQAKTLMQQEGLRASVAASRVGYESAPQFSREFKRYFGYPPSQAVTQSGLGESRHSPF